MKKAISTVLVILLVLSFFSGCAEKKNDAAVITVTDQIGRTVTLEKPATRIASGYYIASSVCLALGLREQIVGLEEKSDKRPIYRLAAPELTENTVCVGSAKSFDTEACLSAHPDLVILPKKASDYVSALEGAGVAVAVVDPEDNERLDQMIRMIGTLTGKTETADKLISRRAEIMVKVMAATETVKEKPAVYFCSPSSFMRTAPIGQYQADLVRKAGGSNVGDALDGSSWQEVSAEQLIKMAPQAVIVPCNSMATGAPDYQKEILTDTVFASLSAVQNGKVYYMPSGLESWDSPVPAGVLGGMWLQMTLHPDLISEEKFREAVTSFYSEFYHIEVDLDEILPKK